MRVLVSIVWLNECVCVCLCVCVCARVDLPNVHWRYDDRSVVAHGDEDLTIK